MIFSKANFGTLSASVAIQLCGVATGIMSARLLGPAARGELATVILWPVILSNLGLLGCNWALAREVARDPQGESGWIANGVAVALGVAPFFAAAGYFLLPRLLRADRLYLLPLARICLLLIPLDICNQVLLSVEQGRMRWLRYNLLRLSFFLFYLLSIVVLALTGRAQLRWFVIAFLASHALAAAIRFWIHRTALSFGRVEPAAWRHLVRAGAPYFGATVSNLASLQLDTILVVSLLNVEAAGIYAVASAFANGQSSLTEALGITSFAEVSNEGNAASREKIISATFRQSALASFGAGLALCIAIPLVAVPMFGAAFARAVWPGVVLAAAAAVMGAANILNQGLRGAGRPHEGVLSQALGIAVLLCGALLFLRRFGLMGMAAAVAISSCVQLVTLVVAAARLLRISPAEFWPFDATTVENFFRQLASFRVRALRLPA